MNKEQAVIFDLDGTLTVNGGRDVYDWSKVELDLVNAPIAQLYFLLKDEGLNIMFVTARPEDAYDGTVAWLEKQLQVTWDTQVLLMRETGDMRPDYEVKKDIYTKYVEPDYKVQLVFEDNPKVAEMYRSLGLPCLLVK